MSLNKLIRNCIPASFLATDVATTQAALVDLKTRCEEWLQAQAQENEEEEETAAAAAVAAAAGAAAVGAVAGTDPYDPRAGKEEDKKKERRTPVTLHSSGFELAPAQLERLYKRMKYDINDTFEEWVRWVSWRRDLGINDFKEADFAVLDKMGFAEWRGQDKEGRPCLVLTARLLDRDLEPHPPVKLFQQYLLHMAEKGVHLCDKLKVERACIIYDRRAMESRHTSTTLHNAVRKILQDVHYFYSRDRIGRLYFVHLNWGYSLLLHGLLKPMMAIFDDSSKMISVQTRRELREYFDSTGLLLAGAGLEHWPKEEEEEELSQVSDAEMDRGTEDAASAAAAAAAAGAVGDVAVGWQEGKGPAEPRKQHEQQEKEKEEEQEMTELKL